MMHNELAEHVATYAAERGDAELEQLCDDVLAGLAEESVLLAVVSGDPELQEAVERGRNAGWRSRRGVQDAFERATLTALLAVTLEGCLQSIDPGGAEARLREQVYRIGYNRERRMAVEIDGVSWPVDLGESG